jgi:hypothetical protein
VLVVIVCAVPQTTESRAADLTGERALLQDQGICGAAAFAHACRKAAPLRPASASRSDFLNGDLRRRGGTVGTAVFASLTIATASRVRFWYFLNTFVSTLASLTTASRACSSINLCGRSCKMVVGYFRLAVPRKFASAGLFGCVLHDYDKGHCRLACILVLRCHRTPSAMTACLCTARAVGIDCARFT